MKLTDVIAVWDILHIKDPGDIGYCDLEKAIDAVVGVENDVCCSQPKSPIGGTFAIVRICTSKPFAFNATSNEINDAIASLFNCKSQH